MATIRCIYPDKIGNQMKEMFDITDTLGKKSML